MSYLVLARKYRPQTFDEIVGQEHVTRTLANAFARGRVHPPFLFCGPRGGGTTTAARAGAPPRARPARVAVRRRARRGQDDGGARAGEGAVLREGADAHAVRDV